MVIDLNEAASPAISAAAGGLSVLTVARIMFKQWLTRYEKLHDITRENEKAVAVLQSQMITVQKDLTGIGNLARKAALPCGNAASP